MTTASRASASVLGAALAVLATSVARADPPPARTLAFDEAVAIAVQRNPDARSSEYDIEGARVARAGTRGELGPKLRAEGNALLWNSAFALPFALPGVTGPPPVLTVRDAFTWSATLTLVQPITPLFAILDAYSDKETGVGLATLQRDATRRDVAFRVAQAYFRLLEASRLAEIAATSVGQLEAQLRQAQSLLNNGVIGKNDLLRAELALATARQRGIQSKGQVVLARGQLASAMGLAPSANIEAIPFAGEAPPNEEPSVESAEEHAVTRRLELREVAMKLDQADARVHLAEKRLLPNVSAVASYMHVEGSAFQQKDAAYVGGILSWDVWDWGTTLSGIHAEDARRQQTRIARTKVEDELRLEARQAFVTADAAKEALAVSRAAVTQAEENYRIVGKRFENNASTSFDMVDAESLLTQARAQVETALYGYLTARVALQRATGALMPRLR